MFGHFDRFILRDLTSIFNFIFEVADHVPVHLVKVLRAQTLAAAGIRLLALKGGFSVLAVGSAGIEANVLTKS